MYTYIGSPCKTAQLEQPESEGQSWSNHVSHSCENNWGWLLTALLSDRSENAPITFWMVMQDIIEMQSQNFFMSILAFNFAFGFYSVSYHTEPWSKLSSWKQKSASIPIQLLTILSCTGKVKSYSCPLSNIQHYTTLNMCVPWKCGRWFCLFGV